MPNKKLRRPRHGEKLGVAWLIVLCVLYLPVSALFKVRYRNLQKMPQQGPAILVLNHVAHLDPILICKMVVDAARRPRFLAKEAIFDVPIVGGFMRWMGHIPVKRGSADANRALDVAVEVLRRGGLIILHPEGTVTRDPAGWPMTGKTGAARLASLMPDVPVIPVAQWGVQQSIDFYNKRFKLLPRPRHTMMVGEPIDLSAFRGREADSATLHAMTDVIMRRLRSDLAVLRGVPAPAGELYHWTKNAA